ncbi:MAG: tRNA (N6-threonylcarbamoyladenosine(37)-N6)-methyltransferase TrmO [Desulfobulbus propionicus]|nr:MAG: tRNA (N6-threonylcarbamoyladenosine(37)-N6)-methyltransferase TrmO [Desulfobulbus propionicus]
MKISYNPIGIVHSPFTQAAGTPIQPARAREVMAQIEIYPQYTEGLTDLDGFSHIMLFCHMHQARPYALQVVPYLDTVKRGLFATRAPSRPNAIGYSLVRLIEIRGNILEVKGMDFLSGTPVLDIKPYVGDFDALSDTRMGWYDKVKGNQAVADERFAQ